MSQRKFHELSVVERRYLSPGMVRLTFTGEELAAFPSTGIGDEYVRLFFPDPASGELVLPEIDDEGHWTFPAERERVRFSTYTIRRFDAPARELDIDFVVHAGGMASDWACAAEPGAAIVINSPRGLYEPPEELSWQVLMADATGLPALARLIEQTPDHVASQIFIEVADRSHEQSLPAHPRATVSWIHGTGNGLCASTLDKQFAQVAMMDGNGYLWAAGEQAAMRAVRRKARKIPAFAGTRCKAIAYWIA
ncbi:siderophore-interacting protein [Ancylobacter oerskovii]|uniref:Siderophore-interacting protein n=1 Tax=Ancylobacter oerskovii TaxID=459519 RepID=A0ABW4YUA5_9HYPH|nr:siderophore-interacting protein [Ancylobacter oerskovii]MBS7543229.1 siderophore-interacting protein [Ancylobacter oerskovii]